MSFPFITADERMHEERGAKVALFGPPGVGKTWQLRTLDLPHTCFIDGEAGDLSVRDVKVDAIRLTDWLMARDIACRIGGANPSFPSHMCYSLAHYEAVSGALPDLNRYTTFFIDSFTEIARMALRWCEQQPEAFSERTGKKDIRGAYGLLAKELLAWVRQLQRARSKNIIFVGILERVTDDFGRSEWQLQCEGSKTPRELPGIIDEVVTYQFIDFGDGKPPTRAFVCNGPNAWGYPAKDRSGRLDQIEPPHLGKLLTKLTTRKPNGDQ